MLDPEVGFSKWDNVVYLLYLDMGGQWYLATVGWGLTMGVQGSETMIMTNHSGALLDPGVELDDLDEFVNWSIQRTDRYNPQKYFTNAAAIYESIEAGFCPDFLALVEPEDCVDPAWMTQNRLERGDFADNVGGAEYGLSVGYRMSPGGVISLEPALTNLPMACPVLVCPVLVCPVLIRPEIQRVKHENRQDKYFMSHRLTVNQRLIVLTVSVGHKFQAFWSLGGGRGPRYSRYCSKLRRKRIVICHQKKAAGSTPSSPSPS